MIHSVRRSLRTCSSIVDLPTTSCSTQSSTSCSKGITISERPRRTTWPERAELLLSTSPTFSAPDGSRRKCSSIVNPRTSKSSSATSTQPLKSIINHHVFKGNFPTGPGGHLAYRAFFRIFYIRERHVHVHSSSPYRLRIHALHNRQPRVRREFSERPRRTTWSERAAFYYIFNIRSARRAPRTCSSIVDQPTTHPCSTQSTTTCPTGLSERPSEDYVAEHAEP